MTNVYCVMKHRTVWDRATWNPTSVATKLLGVFSTYNDACNFAKEDIDKEEERLSKIENSRGVERKSDNTVSCGFGYEDVEYNTEVRVEPLN